MVLFVSLDLIVVVVPVLEQKRLGISFWSASWRAEKRLEFLLAIVRRRLVGRQGKSANRKKSAICMLSGGKIMIFLIYIQIP